MDPRDIGQEYGEVSLSKVEWSWTIGNFERCERTKHKRCIMSPVFVQPACRYGELKCRLLMFPHGSANAGPDDTSIYLYVMLPADSRAVYGGFECWLSRPLDIETENIIVFDSLNGAFEPGYGYGFPKFVKFKTITDAQKTLCPNNQLIVHFTLDFSDRYDVIRNVDEPARNSPVTSECEDNRRLFLKDLMSNLSINDTDETVEQSASDVVKVPLSKIQP